MSTNLRDGKVIHIYFGDMRLRGYLEEEFFLAGTAKRYKPVGTHGNDGKWEVEGAGEASFKTRILVKRPKDPVAEVGPIRGLPIT